MSGVTLMIPGPWQDRKEFIAAVATADTGVLAAGGKLFDAANRQHAEFDVLGRDPGIVREMFVGSGRALDDATLAAIDAHKSIAAVTIEQTNIGLDQRLAIFTGAVRAAGGIAVKVHKSGLSHDWGRWEDQLDGEMPAGLFRLLVLQVRDPERGELTSFGMHQLGCADAAIPVADTSDIDAAWALFEFNIYAWEQQPDLQAGHTFSRADGGIRYRLAHADDGRYPQGHPYSNPHGVWSLEGE